MHDGEPTTCIKFVILQKKSRQNLRQQIWCKALFVSILSDPDQNHECLGALGQSDDRIKINSESQTFHRPSVDRPRPLTFDLILSMKYNSLWSRNIYMMNTAPTDNKAPKGRIKYVSHYETETLYWQFCWYLMCCQLSKKYKINWIGLWTRSCCQSKRQESRFQSWIALK